MFLRFLGFGKIFGIESIVNRYLNIGLKIIRKDDFVFRL